MRTINALLYATRYCT